MLSPINLAQPPAISQLRTNQPKVASMFNAVLSLHQRNIRNKCPCYGQIEIMRMATYRIVLPCLTVNSSRVDSRFVFVVSFSRVKQQWRFRKCRVNSQQNFQEGSRMLLFNFAKCEEEKGASRRASSTIVRCSSSLSFQLSVTKFSRSCLSAMCLGFLHWSMSLLPQTQACSSASCPVLGGLRRCSSLSSLPSCPLFRSLVVSCGCASSPFLPQTSPCATY